MHLKRWGVVLAALAISACGSSDDDASGGASTEPANEATTSPGTSEGSASTSAGTAPGAESTPVSSDGGNAGDPAGDGGDSDAKPGGTFVFLVPTEVRRGIDPVQQSGSAAGGDAFRMSALYGALMMVNAQTGAAEPWFAESLTPNETFTTWTLKLRPGIRFSDGTNYDAEAVKFNWERHADQSLGSIRYGTASKLRLTVVDELTLQVDMDEPNSVFDVVVADELSAIASPAALQLPGEYAEHPSGAGPFVLEEWVRDSKMVLARNSSYWDQPRPYADRVEIRIVSDEAQRLNSFEAGEAQAAYLGEPGRIREAEEGGASVLTPNHLGTSILQFNVSKPPFDDVRVRRAVQLALDTRQMRLVTIGFEDPEDDLTTVFNPRSTWTDVSDESLHYPQNDREAAADLFAEYIAENGPINFTLTNGNAGSAPIGAEFIQAALSEFDGVSVELNLTDVPTLTQALVQGEFQLSSSGFAGIEPFGQFTGVVQTGGSRNFSKFTDPVIDEAIAVARSTGNIDDQRAAIEDVQRAVIENVYFIPTGRYTQALVYDADALHNLNIYEDGIVRWDLLWLS